MMRRFTVFCLALAITLANGSLTAREWKDKSGQLRADGILLTLKNDKVYLEKADGAVVAVILDELSKDDLDHLQSLDEYKSYFAERGKPAFQPPLGVPPVIEMVDIKVDDETFAGEIRRIKDVDRPVKSLSFSPNGGFLAWGSTHLVVYDINKSQTVAYLKDAAQQHYITSLAFTPDGKHLLIGTSNGQVRNFEFLADGKLREASRFIDYTFTSSIISSIAISLDSRYVLSGGRNKICFWRLEDAHELFSVTGISGGVACSYLTPKVGQAVVVDNRGLLLIDIASGQATQRMLGSLSMYQRGAFSPDGTRYARGDGRRVRMWDIKSGKEFPSFDDSENNETPNVVCFLPSGNTLISGGRDRVYVWDVASQRKLYEFVSFASASIDLMAMSPDSRHFAIKNKFTEDLRLFRLPAEFAPAKSKEAGESKTDD